MSSAQHFMLKHHVSVELATHILTICYRQARMKDILKSLLKLTIDVTRLNSEPNAHAEGYSAHLEG